MMRTGPAVVLAETVATVLALRGRAGWCHIRNRMSRAVHYHTISIYIATSLYQLGRLVVLFTLLPGGVCSYDDAACLWHISEFNRSAGLHASVKNTLYCGTRVPSVLSK